MIKIDGSYLEGGGQIIRTALSLSSLTKTAFTVENIRKGRGKPGLKHQHLFAIKALLEQCNAHAEGAEIGSQKLTYIPRELKGGNINIDIETAGSITLVLQAILLPLMFADRNSVITLTGGTDTKWSPLIDYYNEVVLPHYRKFCRQISLKIIKRGYYPKGKGNVIAEVKPKYRIRDFQNFEELQAKVSSQVPQIDITEQGRLVQIKGVSHASADLQNKRVAERQAERATMILKKLNALVDVRVEYNNTLSTGSGISLWAVFSKNDDVNPDNPVILGSDALGEPRKPAESVGEEAAQKLVKEIESGTPVDTHLADNLVPLLVFGGRFVAKNISLHCKTNVWVVNQFFKNKLEIKDNLVFAH